MEKKGHRGLNRERFPVAFQDKAWYPDSVLDSDTGLSCYSASGTGLQSNKCENCSTKIHNSQRVCGKASSKEFHYIFNTLGQNFFNHSKRSAFAQLRYLNENKNSSPFQTLLHPHPIPTPAGFLKAHPQATLPVWKKRNLRSEMMKGTSSFGKRRNKMHMLCHHCGSTAYHLQKSTCGKCGYPGKRKRKYNWSAKAKRRSTTRTSRVRHLKIVYRRFRHGFREGKTPKSKRAAVAATSSS
ncbi:protein AKNAD1 isoform X2 [Physeter macrocephalus]|uniref:Large ribosomal subunit protein eL37 n=1 Tax=Physeter macrocephalus TaxID=9755 RepID=A0A9W2WMT0_PHYMC|nr:protein AKNAD1 isoform X2 [Physeter catodon]